MEMPLQVHTSSWDIAGDINTQILGQWSYDVELGNCNDFIINHLTIKNYPDEHGYGDNQTMIKLAYAFLAARGIK